MIEIAIKMLCAFVMPYALLMLFRAPMNLKIKPIKKYPLASKLIINWLWTLVILDGIVLSLTVFYHQINDTSIATILFVVSLILTTLLIVPGLAAFTQAYETRRDDR